MLGQIKALMYGQNSAHFLFCNFLPKLFFVSFEPVMQFTCLKLSGKAQILLCKRPPFSLNTELKQKIYGVTEKPVIAGFFTQFVRNCGPNPLRD